MSASIIPDGYHFPRPLKGDTIRRATNSDDDVSSIISLMLVVTDGKIFDLIRSGGIDEPGQWLRDNIRKECSCMSFTNYALVFDGRKVIALIAAFDAYIVDRAREVLAAPGFDENKQLIKIAMNHSPGSACNYGSALAIREGYRDISFAVYLMQIITHWSDLTGRPLYTTVRAENKIVAAMYRRRCKDLGYSIGSGDRRCMLYMLEVGGYSAYSSVPSGTIMPNPKTMQK